MALSVSIQKRLGSFSLDVSFSTDGQSPFGLLGASGSGKSVTLQCIAGILTPDRGRIELNGRTLFDSERKINLPPQKRNIGYLFQQYALFPNMTVEQNLLAGVRSGSRAEKKAAVADAIRRFRLDGTEKQYPATLSGGQQQRTALARILVGQPELLLLDEPFSALDGFLKWQLEWELAEYLKPFSGDVVFVTHARDEIRRLCRSACVLEHGRSEASLPADALLDRPQTLAAAQLAGFRNVTAVRAEADGFVFCPAWNLRLRTEKPCQAVALPENALHPALPGEENAFLCRVAGEVSEDAQTTVLLIPDGAEPGTVLCMQKPEGALLSETLRVAIAPEAVLTLGSRIVTT